MAFSRSNCEDGEFVWRRTSAAGNLAPSQFIHTSSFCAIPRKYSAGDLLNRLRADGLIGKPTLSNWELMSISLSVIVVMPIILHLTALE
jgi:hypothetical protein